MGTNMPTDSGDGAPWLAFLLQTADPLFPTGAYAHSLGFEECVRLDLVRDERSLADFLHLHLAPALAAQELPYLRFAHAAAAQPDMNALCVVDREIGAWKLARETREASTQLGRRRLKALRVVCDNPLLAGLEARIESGEAHGHHLTVSALQAIVGSIPLRAALTAYAYQAFAAVCAAALKLIRIGQEGCQRALREAARELPQVVVDSLRVEREEAGWFDPLLEIASMRHERAEERLFIS